MPICGSWTRRVGLQRQDSTQILFSLGVSSHHRYSHFCIPAARAGHRPGRRRRPRDTPYRTGEAYSRPRAIFNTSCFSPENVLSLYCESAGTASDRPFFVPVSPFQGKIVPMKGFSTWHVGGITCHVVFPAPACRGNYKPCTRREKCRKVKNVNVGCGRNAVFRPQDRPRRP